MNIVIVGGTGHLGLGLAFRWAKAGHEIFIGSRSKDRAEEAAQKVNEMIGIDKVCGFDNKTAVTKGNLIVLSVPDSGRIEILSLLKPFLAGKIILDVTVPLHFNPLRYEAPPEGSNALQTQAFLGEEVFVLSGFHTVSASMLASPECQIQGDVIILGNLSEPKQVVLTLAKEIGLRAFDGGGLVHSPAVEGLTPLLIGMNKRYKRGHIGISLTGI